MPQTWIGFSQALQKYELEEHLQMKKIRDRHLQQGDNVDIRNGRDIRLRPSPVVKTCSQISSQSQVSPQIQTTDQIRASNQLNQNIHPNFKWKFTPNFITNLADNSNSKSRTSHVNAGSGVNHTRRQIYCKPGQPSITQCFN